MNPTGTGLVYSTYLGGSALTDAHAIALDSAGRAYLTGYTNATDFPVTSSAFQKVNPKPLVSGAAQGPTVFVTKLNAAGSAVVYSTYLGGLGGSYYKYGEEANGIAIDKTGAAYVTGMTTSTDYPVTPNAFQTTPPVVSGPPLASSFVTKLDPTGSTLAYSTYMGSTDLSAIAVDSAGRACVAGFGAGVGFFTTVGALIHTFPSYNPPFYNACVMKLNTTGTALLYSSNLPAQMSGLGIALDDQGVATICGQADLNGDGPGMFVLRLLTNPIFPDFNSDGHTDLHLRNNVSGDIAAWFMNGAMVQGSSNFSLTPPLTFTLVGVGDFLANTRPTLVFQSERRQPLVHRSVCLEPRRSALKPRKIAMD